jgi:hypothetical protein
VHVIRRLRGTVNNITDDAWLHDVWEPNPIWMAHIELLCTSPARRLLDSVNALDAFDF